MKGTTLYILLCLVCVHLCLGSSSSSSSAGGHHPINDDEKCMNTSLRSLTYLRRALASAINIGRIHHAALRGVSDLTQCGTILIEKGNRKTTSPYGKSQAIQWEDVKSKHKKIFKEVRTSITNTHKVTPHQLLVAMGTNYCLKKDNCQHASQRGWDKWHGKKASEDLERSSDSFNCGSKECCENTAWTSAPNKDEL